MLSIDAENSTLSDILVAVRARTGAAIDMPPGAATERMAARLGPAPLREVLTSLLSGSSYDYIIQASDTNEDEVASVILTPRGKGEALANESISASNSRVRRAPGYTASGKHTFEVSPEPTNETPAPTDVASSEEGESGQQPATVSGENTTATAQAPAESPAETDSNASATPASSLASTDSQSTVQNGQTSGSSSQGSAFGQMVQNMQQLFEQRRQIQVQQNQAVQNQTSGPRN